MFFVNDTQKKRHSKIRVFLKDEPVISVLLSVVDFEWTIRRAIISLGTSSNVEIREGVLRNCSGLDDYKRAWKVEVKPNHGVGLAEIVPNWQFFRTKAYPLRHKIVHGVLGSVSDQYATERVESVLVASAAVCEFADRQGIDIYGRLKVRRKRKG